MRAAARFAPLLGLAVLIASWGRSPAGVLAFGIGLVLVAAVLAAVHHAEVVAHRVGEPFGSLVLAVAVTVIEVGLIVSLMATGGAKAETLARDTVFSAVMLTTAGIVGVSLLAATLRRPIVKFNSEGAGAALATIGALAVLTLVLPTFTHSAPGPMFTDAQLAFAAVSSLALYLLFVFVQTVRHRDYFLEPGVDEHDDAAAHGTRAAAISLGLLLVSLVAVVGLAKTLSPSIEAAVLAAGLPLAFVGVVIALVVLLPEGLAALRAARLGRIQTSLNLAFGSAIASIGLTIPTIAVAQIWLPTRLHLGLGEVQMVLLALSLFVATLTVVPGRATLQQAGVHLAVFAAFLAVSVAP
ncbi:MAG TPA: ionic transporter y4hA [Actinomycetota bacterium]|nr:ionic transporter y4hA [Actinomycetota bacterium]